MEGFRAAAAWFVKSLSGKGLTEMLMTKHMDGNTTSATVAVACQGISISGYCFFFVCSFSVLLLIDVPHATFFSLTTEKYDLDRKITEKTLLNLTHWFKSAVISLMGLTVSEFESDLSPS